MTSFLPPPPLVRPFPNETFMYIFGFCSAATLATCCRVSRHFLALASEPLWRTVRLTRHEQLELLFRSVSMAGQSVVPRLPASLASHLSLHRIQHLTITSSKVLQLPLHLGSNFKGQLHPNRLVLSHLFYLSTSPAYGLFGPVQPRELVYLLPRDKIGERPLSVVRTTHPHLRSRNVIVVVSALDGSHPAPSSAPDPTRPRADEIHTLFFGPDPLADGVHAPLPSKKITLRFVLRPSACIDKTRVKAFLGVRYRLGTLNPTWFSSRRGAFVVEVPTAKAKKWIKQGSSAIPLASRRLVVVKVRPPGSWNEDVSC